MNFELGGEMNPAGTSLDVRLVNQKFIICILWTRRSHSNQRGARLDSEYYYDGQMSCFWIVVVVHGKVLLVLSTCKLTFQRVMHSLPSSWLGVAAVFQAGVAKGLLGGGDGGLQARL